MLRLETSSSGLTADAATRCCDPRECLASCAATGKQTVKNPSARKSAPLNMRELKTKSRETPAKNLRKRTQFVEAEDVACHSSLKKDVNTVGLLWDESFGLGIP